MVKRHCSKCGQLKSINDFVKRTDTKDGHARICKQCKNSNERLRRKLDPTKSRRYNKKSRDKYTSKVRASSSLSSHRKRGFIVEITTEELTEMLETTTHCPICGCKFEMRYGNGFLKTSQTVDRINNEQTLTKDNVWILCHACNSMKGSLTMKEYVEYSRMIVEKFGGYNDRI
jgi:hypothetical protein